MTEPVAYMWKTARGTIVGFTLADDKNPHDGNATPLYTADQLHPRVKMTQAEFDEFDKFFKYRKDTTIFNMIAFIQYIENNETENLYNRFYETGTLEGDVKAQADFAWLWNNYNSLTPEETIEIVPYIKWFVRSKEKYAPDMDQGISESGYLYLTQGNIYSIEYYDITTFKDEAQPFDTKTEAEKWVNPLTEAVQLPVEGE